MVTWQVAAALSVLAFVGVAIMVAAPRWLRRLFLAPHRELKRPRNEVDESLMARVQAEYYRRLRKELSEANRVGDVAKVKTLTALFREASK